VPASADLVLRALALSQQRQLSAWDALILQAALHAGCTTLYSEDFQNGARFDDLLVINPFVLQAHEPAPRARARRR
jgi:predicted nucleic acid-binding protein